MKNRRLYEYFFNGKLKTLKVKINKQTVGNATGEKAARIWNKLINE